MLFRSSLAGALPPALTCVHARATAENREIERGSGGPILEALSGADLSMVLEMGSLNPLTGPQDETNTRSKLLALVSVYYS